MTLETCLGKYLNQQPFLGSWHAKKNKNVRPGAKGCDSLDTSTMTQSYVAVLGKSKISKDKVSTSVGVS